MVEAMASALTIWSTLPGSARNSSELAFCHGRDRGSSGFKLLRSGNVLRRSGQIAVWKTVQGCCSLDTRGEQLHLVRAELTATGRKPVRLERSCDSGEEFRSKCCRCLMCGRRDLFAVLFGNSLAAAGVHPAAGLAIQDAEGYERIIETYHPSRGAWYEEAFARIMSSGMDLYESNIAGYKQELFQKLDGGVETVLELGIGSGPNLQYYGNKPGLQKVIGVDPNLQMAKYCSSTARKAGLSDSQFEFIHGVGEVIPLPDRSVDAVVCTLVLCSVKNVPSTLREVKRVLKPGGSFFFIEHVAASDRTSLRLWQKLLDHLQQFFADGCHLTRDTLREIEGAQFGIVDAQQCTIPGLFVIGPHIAGVAHI